MHHSFQLILQGLQKYRPSRHGRLRSRIIEYVQEPDMLYWLLGIPYKHVSVHKQESCSLLLFHD